jgi:hypothetical protein
MADVVASRRFCATPTIVTIGDRFMACNRIANALNALPDVQEACFLPLASC